SVVDAHASACKHLRSAYPSSDAAIPESARARLAYHELARGDFDAASSLVENSEPGVAWLPFAEELAQAASDDVRLAELSLFAGDVLMAAGDYVLLRQLLGRGFSSAPPDTRVRLTELGVELLLRTAKPERARRLATRSLSWRQQWELETVPALLLLARADVQLGQYERAADR